jgi:putative PIN family toxin of toxin-antitoxin system
MNDSRKLRIILDTNVLIMSIPTRSEHRWIFDKFINEEFDLLISNDILAEYEEILDRKTRPEIKNLIIDLLLTAENVHQTLTYFNWNLIKDDPDDNKFADCAVAGNADYIITHDRHFNILKTVDFPKINVLTIGEFHQLFK